MPTHEDEFYVGYLNRMPDRVRAVVRAAALALGVVLITVAAMAAITQRPASTAAWDSQVVTIEGVLIANPYPLLLVNRSGAAETVILVNPGKCGAFSTSVYCGPLDSGPEAAKIMDTVRSLVGARVSATGTLLTKGGRRMLELERGGESVAAMPGSAPAEIAGPTTPTATAVTVTFTGQVVDPKCYLGAMKPGEGKVHRACAALCIRGGIPPALAVGSAGGNERLVLLADSGGNAANGSLAGWAGEMVSVRGTLHTVGDLEVLWISKNGMSR